MIIKEQDFKDRLKIAMAALDIRPVDLCKKTGLKDSTMSQYMSGYAEPKTDKLLLLANALDVSPVWLMGVNVPMNMKINERELTSFENNLLKAFRTSSIDTQNAVCAILGLTRTSTDSGLSKVVGDKD